MVYFANSVRAQMLKLGRIMHYRYFYLENSVYNII